MKLLFDHNLSPQLVSRLRDCFPNSSHVFPLGLATASDLVVWTYARNEGFTIVTKDADFNDAAILHGVNPVYRLFFTPHAIIAYRRTISSSSALLVIVPSSRPARSSLSTVR